MKLEPNMYGRTFNGYIVKILNVKEDWIETDARFIIRTFPQDFVKASYNIIDLIEEGDYVNKSLVTSINYDLDSEEDIVESITIFDYSVESFSILHEEDIKSIVTKKQFEQMAYKISK